MTRICVGRVVAITGAGRGIGRAYALAFAAHGARVVVNDCDEAVADEVVRAIATQGGEACAVVCDITTPEGGALLIEAAVNAFGALDVLVCNAGVYRVGWLWEQTSDDWDLMMRVHLRGTFCPASAAIAHWRARFEVGEIVAARLICTTSQSGLFGQPGSVPYDSAKAGVVGYMLAAAHELAGYGVCVNAIAPRALTRMVATAAEAFPRMGVPLVKQEQRTSTPSAPEDIAGLVVWLGSVQSNHVTGRVFAAQSGEIRLINGWSDGPAALSPRPFEAEDLAPIISSLIGAPLPSANQAP